MPYGEKVNFKEKLRTGWNRRVLSFCFAWDATRQLMLWKTNVEYKKLKFINK
ncbi:MAG: hypothetical protein ABIO55_15570 [Ginsengibacter sp.]